jgi:hypothetical protein
MLPESGKHPFVTTNYEVAGNGPYSQSEYRFKKRKKKKAMSISGRSPQ